MSESFKYPTLVVASRNAKKQRELVGLLSPYGIDVRSVAEFSDAPDVDETGTTFAENAGLKATQVASAIGQWALADDSGLVVDHLCGAPGVISARYAGPQATDDQNNRKVLAALGGVPMAERGAKFICHLALSDPSGVVRIDVEESCSGRIIESEIGGEGFGYDPLFLIPEYHRTFGQLGLAVKGVLSHRSRALRKLIPQMLTLWSSHLNSK
ncbi:MAG: RdgB/HAM1 family non-canonical purine NTP pyrophosphatase [Planctomycetota bacterium]|nr:RdgB/HAM1 family non-canonical purine NTP pyrophosphatase [Planctomycetota bacterium]MDA1178302.1 RdgB/HAM1 family non-canonical purine NTP pyrophosphatase [Planctomycetota bacterium]